MKLLCMRASFTFLAWQTLISQNFWQFRKAINLCIIRLGRPDSGNAYRQGHYSMKESIIFFNPRSWGKRKFK